MKTTITGDGILAITPETELEEYALRHWKSDWDKCRATLNIAIEHGGGDVDPYQMPAAGKLHKPVQVHPKEITDE